MFPRARSFGVPWDSSGPAHPLIPTPWLESQVQLRGKSQVFSVPKARSRPSQRTCLSSGLGKTHVGVSSPSHVIKPLPSRHHCPGPTHRSSGNRSLSADLLGLWSLPIPPSDPRVSLMPPSLRVSTCCPTFRSPPPWLAPLPTSGLPLWVS